MSIDRMIYSAAKIGITRTNVLWREELLDHKGKVLTEELINEIYTDISVFIEKNFNG